MKVGVDFPQPECPVFELYVDLSLPGRNPRLFMQTVSSIAGVSGLLMAVPSPERMVWLLE